MRSPDRSIRASFFMGCFILGVTLPFGPAVAQYTEVDVDVDLRAGVEVGVEVLTRGPVHEAFAETVVFDPQPTVLVSRAPYEVIEEAPPDQRPEGPDVVWIPGYWGWDDERDDFLWISGVWRTAPMGRQWVAGYWRGAGGGHQWVSGYWAEADVDDVEYLPEPPDEVEEVVVTAPSPDHVWIPGVWIWRHPGYVWRPGYWAELRPDWVWVPAHYTWCPRGYVFVDGYWDYAVARRGVLYAPVYFDRGMIAGRARIYSPRVAINLDVFTDHLFVRPAYHHYYFGDYYAARYESAGYCPSFSVIARRQAYDPIYAHVRWDHRHEGDWDRRVEATYMQRRDNESLRPPRTLSASIELRSRRAEPEARNLMLATSINQMAKRPTGGVRFAQVDQNERRDFEERAKLTRRFVQERSDAENSPRRAAPDTASEQRATPEQRVAPDQREPVRAKLPKSPVQGKPGRDAGPDRQPPKKQTVPAPDSSVKPKPKKSKGEKPKETGKPKEKEKEKGKDKDKDKDD